MTTAIILAGGLGTRLKAAVPDLPKPMAPVAGRPFLAHLLDYWAAQGIARFVLSVGYRREAIIDHFGAAYRGLPIDYAIETELLGTGGGLLLAAKGITETFLLVNGDTFFEVGLASLLQFHRSRQSSWTFSLFRAAEAGRYMGMEVDDDARIVSLAAGRGEPGRLANGGVYLVEPAALAGCGFVAGQALSLEEQLLPTLAMRHALYGMECDGRFIDIGIPADYQRAAAVLP